MQRLSLFIALSVFLGCVAAPTGLPKSVPPNLSEVPPEVTEALARAQSAEDLVPLLNAEALPVRVAAARRAGEIGGTEIIGALESVVTSGDNVPGSMEPDYFRREAIHAIAKIGGPEALSAIRRILDRYVHRGPGTFPYIWRNGEYTTVVNSTLEALMRWTDEPEVLAYLEDVAIQGDERFFDARMRETAYVGILQHEMEVAGISSVRGRADYLMARLTGPGGGHKHDWVEGKTGVKTVEALRNSAIMRLLVESGEPVRPFVEERLAQANDATNEHREALLMVLRLLDSRRQRDLRDTCAAQLSVLAGAVLRYGDTHGGQLPPQTSWRDDIRGEFARGAELHCPASTAVSEIRYEINPNVAGRTIRDFTDPRRTVLLYEVDQNGNPVFPHLRAANYAFLDGRVTAYPAEWRGPDHPTAEGHE